MPSVFSFIKSIMLYEILSCISSGCWWNTLKSSQILDLSPGTEVGQKVHPFSSALTLCSVN